MGKKSRLKRERKQQPQPKNVLIYDEHKKVEHYFTPQQMKVVSEMVHRARKEGREKAALEFVEWFQAITEIKGIGPKLQRDLTNHFLAYRRPGEESGGNGSDTN